MQQWWRCGFAVLAIIIIGWIFFLYFAPNGEYNYSYYFDNKPTLISEFSPSGRALEREQNSANGEFYQRIIIDPVYFSIDLPSPYPQADVTIEYQNPSQNIIQLGLRLDDDEDAWNYSYQPLENKFIDATSWPVIENDQYQLFQEDPKYETVENFLAYPPTDSRVGTFLSSFEFPFIDPYYVTSPTGTTIDTPLRGRHELYTYIKDETLDLAVTYQDINYGAGPDPLKINVYHAGVNSFSQEWADDGEEGITGVTNGENTAHIILPELVEGVYRIVLEANDDVMITNIDSAQHKLVFKGRLHLAGSPEYVGTIPNININPTNVISDAQYISLNAKHQYGLGTYEFYDRPVVIPKENIAYIWRNPISNYHHSFIVPQNDVELTTTGIMSLSEAAWFDPLFGFEPLSQYSQLSNLDYVITGKYDYPERIRNWTIATATFDLTEAYRDDPTHLDFILSAAGLDEVPEGLKVRSISISAHKEPVSLKTLWPRLRAKIFSSD